MKEKTANSKETKHGNIYWSSHRTGDEKIVINVYRCTKCVGNNGIVDWICFAFKSIFLVGNSVDLVDRSGSCVRVCVWKYVYRIFIGSLILCLSCVLLTVSSYFRFLRNKFHSVKLNKCALSRIQNMWINSSPYPGEENKMEPDIVGMRHFSPANDRLEVEHILGR